MNKFYATSPERYTFQKNNQEKMYESGNLSKETFESLKKMWDDARIKDLTPEKDTSLEKDLRSSEDVSKKCQDSKVYSQNLYAALCNNDFFKDKIKWHCSWRHAGGIVASLNQKGDYINWYCSGIEAREPYVQEGFVTEQIKNDIEGFGWKILKKFN